MTDERYSLFEDSREKAHTARSARSARTHCGKSGPAKFVTDYMTEKERNAMNGKVETYRMNSPMKWDEFTRMPDDLQKIYILNLRKYYGVTDKALAEMFGIQRSKLCVWMKEHKLSNGLTGGNSHRKWEKEKLLAWVNGADPKAVSGEAEVETETEPEEIEQVTIEETVVDVDTNVEDFLQDIYQEATDEETEGDYSGIEDCSKLPLVPATGSMTYEGNVSDILRSVGDLLCNKRLSMTIMWRPIVEETKLGPVID